MKTLRFLSALIIAVSISFVEGIVHAGPPLQKCAIQSPITPGCEQRTSSQPQCGLELTCTDKPVLLGNPQGVCFRATCPGIWALIHERIDQSSFRRRFISYRHYSFKGYWDLKDQGIIEAVGTPIRELFLVLPDDLIEFKMTDPDCFAKVEIKKLGYIKTGSLKELQEWLAYNTYLEKPDLTTTNGNSRFGQSSGVFGDPSWANFTGGGTSFGLRSIGNALGITYGGCR